MHRRLWHLERGTSSTIGLVPGTFGSRYPAERQGAYTSKYRDHYNRQAIEAFEHPSLACLLVIVVLEISPAISVMARISILIYAFCIYLKTSVVNGIIR
jgi:hypothetical protein